MWSSALEVMIYKKKEALETQLESYFWANHGQIKGTCRIVVQK